MRGAANPYEAGTTQDMQSIAKSAKELENPRGPLSDLQAAHAAVCVNTWGWKRRQRAQPAKIQMHEIKGWAEVTHEEKEVKIIREQNSPIAIDHAFDRRSHRHIKDLTPRTVCTNWFLSFRCDKGQHTKPRPLPPPKLSEVAKQRKNGESTGTTLPGNTVAGACGTSARRVTGTDATHRF